MWCVCVWGRGCSTSPTGCKVTEAPTVMRQGQLQNDTSPCRHAEGPAQ